MGQFKEFVKWYINYIDAELCIFVSIVAISIFLLGLVLNHTAFKRMGKKVKSLNKWSGLAYAGLSYELAFVLTVTLSGRERIMDNSWEVIPFASWHIVFEEGNIALLIQILANILLFIPLGFLLPCCFKRCRRYRYTILSSALLSLTIELIQGIAQIGLFETDDVIHNTLGACVGLGAYAVIRRSRK